MTNVPATGKAGFTADVPSALAKIAEINVKQDSS